VITGQFQAAVKKEGLFYPPDPASLDFCTMGGNVAECSGGPSAVKYGVTRDYVLGLEVVLPDGRLMHTGVRTAKGVVGYDLTRLFIGSEGTLGVITKIVVRLLALPTHKKTYLVLCDSLLQAAVLVSEILKSGILPRTLEYMDQTALNVVREYLPLDMPQSTRALLLIEVDGDEKSTDEQGEKLLKLLADRQTYPGILEVRQAHNTEEVEDLWKARRSISPATFKLRPHKISEDVVVPKTKIPQLVDFTEKLSRKLDIVILTFGHAGDGKTSLGDGFAGDAGAAVIAARPNVLFELAVRGGMQPFVRARYRVQSVPVRRLRHRNNKGVGRQLLQSSGDWNGTTATLIVGVAKPHFLDLDLSDCDAISIAQYPDWCYEEPEFNALLACVLDLMICSRHFRFAAPVQ